MGCSVRYLVDDVDSAIAFYTGMLGFEIVQQYGGAMAILSHGGMTLWLAGPASSAARPLPDGARPAPGGWNRIVIDVDDLDSVIERLRANGVRFRNDPVSEPGGTQVLIEDPSENLVELFYARRPAADAATETDS